jgi:hypothetical protein
MQFETRWKAQQKKKAIVERYKSMGKEPKEEEDKLPLLKSPKSKRTKKKKPNKSRSQSKERKPARRRR